MIFVIWFVLALIVGFVAKSCGRSSVLWFIISCIISPLGGFILLVATSGK